MVLNVIDEIIDGQPKYNITDNLDGTKNIELANEVVTQGTPLNKNIFNKIENVLSYQVPNYTSQPVTIHYKSKDILPILQSSWNEEGIYKQSASTETILGKFTLSTSVNTSGYNAYYVFDNNTSTSSRYGTNNNSFYFYFDNYNIIIKKIKVYMVTDVRFYIYGVKSDLTETEIATGKVYSQWVEFDLSDNTQEFEKIYIKSASSNPLIGELEFEFDIEGISYNFELENLGNTFINNQIVLIQTPNSVISGNCTLNGKDIDSVLSPNKNYELVYNEQQDKFIAYEVRN